MEDTSRLCKCLNFFLIFTIHGLLVKGARSKVYTVGDDEGWDSGVDYGVWSSKYNFSTGDILVFKYLKSQHDVYEVTEPTFRSCDDSTGVLARYETGNDEVTLDQERKYWFICSIGGHCFGGMRFGVEVNAASGSNNNSTNGASSPQAQPPPSTQGSDNDNGSSKLYGPRRWSLGVCLIVLAVLFELFY
ncbi:hypothetical protein CRG98_027152 [Punica granatum]|uniref:Phytocyanin domain-containing protein n=1 Tax=Punica granatum TaxID=22663 RepID=A0A2I0J989_PUNGR|nr:hypothetical protein CRG98_027152 [Punica granatum]